MQHYSDQPFAFPLLDVSVYGFEDAPVKVHKGHHSPLHVPKRIPHGEVLTNFAKLLQFWGYGRSMFEEGIVCNLVLCIVLFGSVYYTTRGRDQRGLATSSGFRVGAWQKAIALLLSNSPSGLIRS